MLLGHYDPVDSMILKVSLVNRSFILCSHNKIIVAQIKKQYWASLDEHSNFHREVAQIALISTLLLPSFLQYMSIDIGMWNVP